MEVFQCCTSGSFAGYICISGHQSVFIPSTLSTWLGLVHMKTGCHILQSSLNSSKTFDVASNVRKDQEIKNPTWIREITLSVMSVIKSIKRLCSCFSDKIAGVSVSEARQFGLSDA